MSEASTLVKNAIFNPSEPRHFMTITETTHKITAQLGDIILANSQAALKVKEVGRGIYDPVIYFPRSDIKMQYLASNDKTTHCPLKGDTEYFDLTPSNTTPNTASNLPLKNVAWSYNRTIERAGKLQDYIGFDTSKVLIIEHLLTD